VKYSFRSVTKQIPPKIWKINMKFTGPIRLKPDFIIFGAQRCGTTSLYNYLIEHPTIAPPLAKEIGFFDSNYARGINWYKAHFPTYFQKFYVTQIKKKDFITGEATPSYINHPLAHKRIFDTIPKVKLIVLLRNPVDRAYSHYYQACKLGREYLSFSKAIKKEPFRLQGEKKKMMENDDYYSKSYHYFGYLFAGMYLDLLKPWLNTFPKKQILILKSEDLYTNPNSIFNKTLKFLNVTPWELQEYKKYNYHENRLKIDITIQKYLADYFRPHNERLYKYLGMNFNWEM